MSSSHPPDRPTAEEWYSITSAIEDTSPEPEHEPPTTRPSTEQAGTRSRDQRPPKRRRPLKTILQSLAAIATVLFIAFAAGMCISYAGPSILTDTADSSINANPSLLETRPTRTLHPTFTPVPTRNDAIALYSLQKPDTGTTMARQEQPNPTFDPRSIMEYEDFSQATAHKLKGVAQAAQGHPELAIESYSRAIIYGDDADIRVLRANAYLAENQCPEATTDANAALLMEPLYEKGYHTNASANTVLGICSYRDGDLLRAEQYITEALNIMHGTEYQVEVTHYWTELLTKIRQETGR